MPDPALKAVGLVKRYAHRVVTNSLNIEIEEGITYGLIGPNGAGKTTFIRLAVGLIDADEGDILVLGKRMPDRNVAPKIGYMTQKGALYADLTVVENLKFFAALYGLSGVERAKRIDETLETVELSDRRDEIVANLSGGMIQRVSLAAAMIHKPRLMLLDEPTAGVDPDLRLRFWAYFERLNADGVTIVVSTHHLDEANRCARIGMLRRGKLIAEGPPNDLKARAGAKDLEEAFLKISKAGGDGDD